jgi:pimeloyl-ACP methyl ester carboxylesterase
LRKEIVVNASTAIRRLQLLGAGATASLALLAALTVGAHSAPAATHVVKPQNLPAGFWSTFTSRFVNADGLRMHVVIGGDGPPLLLVHGWPENWYQWHLLMPALARDYTVIAVDQRGYGSTDKPATGYDAGTLASDLAALMNTLGFEHYAVAGADIGLVVSYALAADHPDSVSALAVAEGPLPGIAPSPPIFAPDPVNSRLWHIGLNRAAGINEQLVRGREKTYFGYEFTTGAAKKLPTADVKYYIDSIATAPNGLHGSFGFYTALDATIAQNQQRMTHRLTMPVLGIGGAFSLGAAAAAQMKLVADNVQTAVIPGAGHFVAEEAPAEMLAALTTFLAPYRAASATR